MHDQTDELKQTASGKQIFEKRKKIIAIGSTFIITCMFSYFLGTQQQVNQMSLMAANAGSQFTRSNMQTGVAGGVNEQPMGMNDQFGASFSSTETAGPPAQYNTQTDVYDNSERQMPEVNEQCSTGGNHQQSNVGLGKGLMQGNNANMRHGGRNMSMEQGNSMNLPQGGNMSAQDNYSNSQGVYSATTQRCCATGKTGTCHS